MTNLEVISSWLGRQPAANSALSTDGTTLWELGHELARISREPRRNDDGIVHCSAHGAYAAHAWHMASAEGYICKLSTTEEQRR